MRGRQRRSGQNKHNRRDEVVKDNGDGDASARKVVDHLRPCVSLQYLLQASQECQLHSRTNLASGLLLSLRKKDFQGKRQVSSVQTANRKDYTTHKYLMFENSIIFAQHIRQTFCPFAV
jgi:hypothetical protein